MERACKQNEVQFKYWNEAVGLEEPEAPDLDLLVTQMESAAAQMNTALQAKSANLIVAIEDEEIRRVLAGWNTARDAIRKAIEPLERYNNQVEEIKKTVDSQKLAPLQVELKVLQAVKSRHEQSIADKISNLEKMRNRKTEISKNKAFLRKDLTAHGKTITEGLGKAINAYLKRLNAGFRVDYKEPDYRGKEPAARYRILINEVAVSPRATSEATGKPSFRNTLSAGDKSVLALALFLAQCNADPEIEDAIVVLDKYEYYTKSLR